MHKPVLVLNANFEPINVCNPRRAISLVLSGKADLVLNGRGVIHTVSRTYPEPSIIRLEKMVRRPRPHVRLTKREILRRDNYICQYCGQPSAHLTVDHVMPRFRGGQYSWENLVTACPQCNRRKGGRTIQEARMMLRRHPFEPQPTARYLYSRHLRDYVEWNKYLEGW